MIYVLIYLVIGVISYFPLRKGYKYINDIKDNSNYLVSDRNVVLLTCALWPMATFIVPAMVCGEYNHRNKNKTANW